ncbi:MAG: metalloregulator ArsR/SmtB family transcription factor [Candidatus Eiseniibacteriota bacterium]|jgi:DNA-binding transcriptional ArsR family regulator
MDDRCCTAFRALGDPTRLRILELLKREELCVSEIGQHFEMTQPSISHHLDILRRAGLVTREKRGRETYYRFNGHAIIECCGQQLRLLDLRLIRR